MKVAATLWESGLVCLIQTISEGFRVKFSQGRECNYLLGALRSSPGSEEESASAF